MFGMGDEMFGKWETKVRRKSPAACQVVLVKKKKLKDILENL